MSLELGLLLIGLLLLGWLGHLIETRCYDCVYYLGLIEACSKCQNKAIEGITRK